MFLKRIEMQGFKSFAGKMTLEFHNGVTAIVGPNGSGKSNVADAVRWVLGEQSARQLRGGNMQDVIFAGTESRKPLGFASVSISFDNEDHKLNLDYPEVTVTRRLYRSGESEYMINGSSCRLKDIQELFYDTGIGKEGYSMIGQGQIDKILNGKPEERRELFDEAAGIVKFKRRKLATLKKLEKEEENLTRITDILKELTKQVVPLEKQSAKAKIYLNKKEELKERDLTIFCFNDEKTEKVLSELNSKNDIAKAQLEETDKEYEGTKSEYEVIDEKLSELDNGINYLHESINETAAKKQQCESQIQLFNEQLKGAENNRTMLKAQIEAFEDDKNRRKNILKEYFNEKTALEREKEENTRLLNNAENEAANIRELLNKENIESEKNKERLIEILNSRSNIKEKSQRYITLNEQIEVRKSSLTARMLKLSDEKKRLRENEEKNRIEYNRICGEIEVLENNINETKDKLLEIKQKLTDIDAKIDIIYTNYHKQQSLLESLSNLAERYEGYGISVRKVMEQQKRNQGILGVVAEIISTKKKYETAVETALGGTLQNIVTDNEATAKYLIEYLKRGHYGRATFLPLSAIRDSKSPSNTLNEEGVIGLASELVDYDDRFRGIVNRLLGKTYVIDNIDHAISIGRKYKHQYRMVTLEGELMAPGGAMTGGSYKNSNNLLGRTRQIDELKEQVKASKKELQEKESVITALKDERNSLRLKQNKSNDELQQLYIDKNTAEVNLRTAIEQTDEVLKDNTSLEKEKTELIRQKTEIDDFIKSVNIEMDSSNAEETKINQLIADSSKKVEEFSIKEKESSDTLENIKLRYNAVMQKFDFNEKNISNEENEIEQIQIKIDEINKKISDDLENTDEKNTLIEETKILSLKHQTELESLNNELSDKMQSKEEFNKSHKALFTKREELSEKKNLLNKEIYRLESLIERNENYREKNINYLWEEYEMTPADVENVEYKDDDYELLKKEIAELKREIKELGNINVNAIEEYKEVKERHEFLSAQYDDIVKAAENLKSIIEELDKGMHKQFTEEFLNIQKEFNKVFKQLFGGGMGTLELVEDQDILEAGVRIVAQPPGKKLQNMMQLSGGEKTLTAIALLFAIQNLKPSPFCLLDEIEAALDDANVDRFAKYLHKLSGTQFIVITHRRGTMTSADRLYGITMQEKGISTMVSVDLIESQLK